MGWWGKKKKLHQTDTFQIKAGPDEERASQCGIIYQNLMAIKGLPLPPEEMCCGETSSVACVLTIKVNDSHTMGHYCKRLLSIMRKQPLI